MHVPLRRPMRACAWRAKTGLRSCSASLPSSARRVPSRVGAPPRRGTPSQQRAADHWRTRTHTRTRHTAVAALPTRRFATVCIHEAFSRVPHAHTRGATAPRAGCTQRRRVRRHCARRRAPRRPGPVPHPLFMFCVSTCARVMLALGLPRVSRAGLPAPSCLVCRASVCFCLRACSVWGSRRQ